MDMDPTVMKYLENRTCVVTRFFEKAANWLKGCDFNETPAPDQAPDRDGGPS